MDVKEIAEFVLNYYKGKKRDSSCDELIPLLIKNPGAFEYINKDASYAKHFLYKKFIESKSFRLYMVKEMESYLTLRQLIITVQKYPSAMKQIPNTNKYYNRLLKASKPTGMVAMAPCVFKFYK